jgi:hypothetical protein
VPAAKPYNQNGDLFLGTWLPARKRKAFYALAKRNRRSAAAELRIAVENHLDAARAEVAK